jgi:RNA polymerase subunit RPABC4/transcription elongation factor Spt4
MNKEKACRSCRAIVLEGDVCPSCGEKNLTTFWRGYVIVTKPELSEIAKRMGIEKKGKFALRLSR